MKARIAGNCEAWTSNPLSSTAGRARARGNPIANSLAARCKSRASECRQEDHRALSPSRFQHRLPARRRGLHARACSRQGAQDAGLEENEAEKLNVRNTDLRRDYDRLRREKRLSDQAAERNYAEVERLKAEN